MVNGAELFNSATTGAIFYRHCMMIFTVQLLLQLALTASPRVKYGGGGQAYRGEGKMKTRNVVANDGGDDVITIGLVAAPSIPPSCACEYSCSRAAVAIPAIEAAIERQRALQADAYAFLPDNDDDDDERTKGPSNDLL